MVTGYPSMKNNVKRNENPVYYWLIPPEDDEEKFKDPLRLSDYFSKLASAMLPDLSTMTNKGPLYYLFTYWAAPENKDNPNCFFYQKNSLATLENYNKMEWAFSKLNEHCKISPIGKRSLSDLEKAHSDPVTTQSGRVRYLERAKGLAKENEFRKILEEFNQTPGIHSFFDGVITSNEIPSMKDIPKTVKMTLNLEISKYCQPIYKILRNRPTELGTTQGIFMEEVRDRKNEDDTLGKDIHSNYVAFCVNERKLGKIALDLYNKYLGNPDDKMLLTKEYVKKIDSNKSNKNDILNKFDSLKKYKDSRPPNGIFETLECKDNDSLERIFKNIKEKTDGKIGNNVPNLYRGSVMSMIR